METPQCAYLTDPTGKEHLLDQPEVRMGRAVENEIVIVSKRISREHARIWRDGRRIFLENLGSTNSIFIIGVIFSGEERLQIADTEFELDDTDKAMDKKLFMDQADIWHLKKWTRHLLSRLSNLPTPEIGILRAVAIGIGLLVLANLFALSVSILVGHGVIFGRGWPMELLLASIFFSFMLAATRSFWWLFPAGLLLGNGIIFSYNSLTGFWRHWIFLRPLELLLIAAVFFGGRGLFQHKNEYPGLSRTLGYLGVWVAIGWGALIALGVTLFALLHILS